MKINDALKKYSLVSTRYQKKGNVSIATTNEGKLVFKDTKIDKQIFDYLKSRSFGYMPKFINDEDDEYQLTEYLESFDIPKERQILDLVDLVALLHNKTTHYKELDINDYEQIYEDINNNLEYLHGYYTDMITLIESKVFMSPSEYLLARNINVIFRAIDDCKINLDEWHEKAKNIRKRRDVVLHNNLKLEHFIRNENSYLISWDKAKIGSPVFDLYKLYLNHALDFDFDAVFKEYESNYPLTDEERSLLFTLISMPRLILFNETEYQMCYRISHEIDIIYKTSMLKSKIT